MQLEKYFGAFPPAAAAVIDGGKVVGMHGDADEIYPLASVTKPIVAWAILIAVEEGVFELDDAVGPGGSTVAQLLAHTSGVGFAGRDLVKKPGTRRIYSSAGYEILADAVETASGIAFPDYLRQAVLEPLGMDSTQLEGSAGHGMSSSVSDLIHFVDEVCHPRLIDSSTADAALRVQFPGLDGVVPGYGMFKPCDWGFGFEIKDHKEPHWMGSSMPADCVGHFGQAGTYMWVHRPTARAAIVLTKTPFGPWAKPLWQTTNDGLWAVLSGTTYPQ